MYEGWQTIPEVVKEFGLSERTIYRRIKDGSLRQARRPVSNSKPLVILHPDDVQRLREELLTPEPVAVEAKLVKSAVPAKLADSATWESIAAHLADISAVLKDATAPARAKEQWLLSLKDAANLSGLSKDRLRKAIQVGELQAREEKRGRGVRCWIHREALSRFCVTFGRMTEQRQIGSNGSVPQIAHHDNEPRED